MFWLSKLQQNPPPRQERQFPPDVLAASQFFSNLWTTTMGFPILTNYPLLENTGLIICVGSQTTDTLINHFLEKPPTPSDTPPWFLNSQHSGADGTSLFRQVCLLFFPARLPNSPNQGNFSRGSFPLCQTLC